MQPSYRLRGFTSSPLGQACARRALCNLGKGKDNEPIDDFKGVVIFDSGIRDDDQDKYLMLWDEQMVSRMVAIRFHCQRL